MSLSKQKDDIMLNPDISVKLLNGIQVLMSIFKKIDTKQAGFYEIKLNSVVEQLNWNGIEGIKPRKCAELIQKSIVFIERVFYGRILPTDELYVKFKIAEEILDIAITEIKLVYDAN
ncbi:hypothetical protein D3C71_1382810 [compost metagenome]